MPKDVAGQSRDNSGGGEIFRAFPERLCGPPSSLHNEYLISFPGVKRPGMALTTHLHLSDEVKESVELYLYSPCGHSWPVVG